MATRLDLILDLVDKQSVSSNFDTPFYRQRGFWDIMFHVVSAVGDFLFCQGKLSAAQLCKSIVSTAHQNVYSQIDLAQLIETKLTKLNLATQLAKQSNQALTEQDQTLINSLLEELVQLRNQLLNQHGKEQSH